MNLNLDNIVEILKNHTDDDRRLLSLKVLMNFVKIECFEDLKKISLVFFDKSNIFNFLFDNNLLSDVQIEHLRFSGFLIDTKILNENVEKETLKKMLKISPDMIIDVLNFIKGFNKTDDYKLELINTVNENSDIIRKLIKEIGEENFSILMSEYFVHYSNFVFCCNSFQISENVYNKFEEKINEDNDTITIFDTEKLKISNMKRGKWYSFEKQISDDQTMIYNIKKIADPNKSYSLADNINLRVERYTSINSTGQLIDEKLLTFKIFSKCETVETKGFVFNEHVQKESK